MNRQKEYSDNGRYTEIRKVGSEPAPVPVGGTSTSCAYFNEETGEGNAYLRTMEVDHLDYDKANAYFEKNPYIPPSFGCTSAIFGNVNAALRHYDWTYDSMMQFAVMARDDRFEGSFCMSAIPGLEVDTFSCDSADKPDLDLVPFFALDGINGDGLYCAMNVVPTCAEFGVTSTTTPTVEKRDRVCTMMLVRYILDHFSSATEAVDYIAKYVELFNPKGLVDMSIQLHFHIADANGTCIVLETIGDEVKITPNHIATNFYEHGVTGLSWYLPTTEDYNGGSGQGEKPTSCGLQENAQGVERYNKCFGKVLSNECEDIDDIKEFSKELNFSRLYNKDEFDQNEETYWYSEYSDQVYYGIDAATSVYSTAISAWGSAWANKYRGCPCWTSRHSVVYDLSEGDAYVEVEESGKWDKFSCPKKSN